MHSYNGQVVTAIHLQVRGESMEEGEESSGRVNFPDLRDSNSPDSMLLRAAERYGQSYDLRYAQTSIQGWLEGGSARGLTENERRPWACWPLCPLRWLEASQNSKMKQSRQIRGDRLGTESLVCQEGGQKTDRGFRQRKGRYLVEFTEIQIVTLAEEYVVLVLLAVPCAK